MTLHFNHVTKTFGGIHAVEDVSFELIPGRIYSLIGPNGAGKSTIVNMAAGSYSLSKGTITLGDVTLSKLKKHKIAQAGLSRTYQNIRLFDYMTALENLEVALVGPLARRIPEEIFFPWLDRKHKEERRQRCMAVLADFALAHRAHELAVNLAYGEQKRLEICRALVADPKVLLLDEPAAGLNNRETADLTERILGLKSPELVILVVEHDMKLVMSISDEIVVLHQGKLLARGTPEIIQSNEAVKEAYLGNERTAETLKTAARRRRDRLGIRPGQRSAWRLA